MQCAERHGRNHCLTTLKMILQRIKRKLYKAFHPVVGEIWMLHRVAEQRSEKPEQRELEVTPDWLEHKILEYQEKGYRFISIDEAAEILQRTQLSTVNCKLSTFVCVTFDDGYRDNYTLAYPLLKRLNVPFTVYVTTGFIDNRLPMWWYRCESREQCQTCLSNAEVQQRERSYPNQQLGMSAKELRQLDADPLCTIGAHTVSHPKLDTLSYEEQYKEIADSKLELERLLGHPIQHFSFPHGAYNANTLAICHELGFKTVVQSWGGAVRRGVHYKVLPRITTSLCSSPLLYQYTT